MLRYHRGMSPQAHLTNLKVRLNALGKRTDPRALEAFIASAEFDAHWLGLRGDRRRRATVVKLLAQARSACQPQKPLITAPGEKTRKWNEIKIAQLRASWARWGSDESVARDLEISVGAAQRARWRYIGPAVVEPTLRVAHAA